MTIEALVQSVAATGPMAGLLLYALYYQTQRVRALEAKVEALYERVMQVMKNAANHGDSHDGTGPTS
jgi:hypothetical protein